MKLPRKFRGSSGVISEYTKLPNRTRDLNLINISILNPKHLMKHLEVALRAETANNGPPYVRGTFDLSDYILLLDFQAFGSTTTEFRSAGRIDVGTTFAQCGKGNLPFPQLTRAIA